MMGRSALDEVTNELRSASFDLRAHLAWVKLDRRLALELRYRFDQARAPRGTPEGGQFVTILSTSQHDALDHAATASLAAAKMVVPPARRG